MKLNELLDKITRLPWLQVIATDGDKWIGTRQGDDRIATLDGNTGAFDHTYLVQAANVLPELVAAAKNIQENWEHNLTEPMARLNKALALAVEISLEPGTIIAAPAVKIGLPARETLRPGVITQEQELAIRRFLECWNLSMPYHDIGQALNCGECNALYNMLLAFGESHAAQALMQAHVAGDDEGDDPEHFRMRANNANGS